MGRNLLMLINRILFLVPAREEKFRDIILQYRNKLCFYTSPELENSQILWNEFSQIIYSSLPVVTFAKNNLFSWTGEVILALTNKDNMPLPEYFNEKEKQNTPNNKNKKINPEKLDPVTSCLQRIKEVLEPRHKHLIFRLIEEQKKKNNQQELIIQDLRNIIKFMIDHTN